MRLQRNIEKSWKIYYSCKRAMQRKIKMQSIQKYNLHIKKNHYIFGGGGFTKSNLCNLSKKTCYFDKKKNR